MNAAIIPMELTYTVRGDDGQEYGPATLEQLTGWAREGRVRAQQGIKRSDMQHWAVAGSYSELQHVFASHPTATPQPLPAVAVQGADPAVERQMKSGASWFYWIAGLSLVNTIAAISGSDWRFIVGLGVTQIFDVIGGQIGGAGKFVALALDLVAAGVFILFGVFSHKRHTWAFIVGMVLFGLDGLLLLVLGDWIGVAFHVFVLFCLFRGFSACRQLGAA
jgi:hypothetical protein